MKTYSNSRAILNVHPSVFSGCKFILAGDIRNNQVHVTIYPDSNTCFLRQKIDRKEFKVLLDSWVEVGASIKASMVIDLDK